MHSALSEKHYTQLYLMVISNIITDLKETLANKLKASQILKIISFIETFLETFSMMKLCASY